MVAPVAGPGGLALLAEAPLHHGGHRLRDQPPALEVTIQPVSDLSRAVPLIDVQTHRSGDPAPVPDGSVEPLALGVAPQPEPHERREPLPGGGFAGPGHPRSEVIEVPFDVDA